MYKWILVLSNGNYDVACWLWLVFMALVFAALIFVVSFIVDRAM